jgi:ATP-binding cassette subfamily C protein LapB
LSQSEKPSAISATSFLRAYQDALSATRQECDGEALLSGMPKDNEVSLTWLKRAGDRHGVHGVLLSLEDALQEHSSAELLVCLSGGEFGQCLARISLGVAKSEPFLVEIYGNDGSNKCHELSAKALSAMVSERVLRLSQPVVDMSENQEERKFTSWLVKEFVRLGPLYRDVLLATVLLNLFVIVSPLFVMNVYDRVVPNQAFETLWALAIGVLVVLGFDLVIKLLRHYFVESAGRQVDVVLSTKLFSHVMNLRPQQLPDSVGSFASQFREFDSIKQFFTAASFASLVDLPFALMFLFIIYYLNSSIAMVPIFAAALIVIYGVVVHFPLKKIVQRTQAAAAIKNANLIESLSVAETLKVFNAEGRAQGHWEQASVLLARMGLTSRRLADSIGMVSSFLMQLSMLGVVIVGVYQIAESQISLGALIACVLLGNRALAPMIQMAHLSAQFFQAREALIGLNKLCECDTEQGENKRYLRYQRLNGAIEFDSVGLGFEHRPDVLKKIDLKISEGEHVALIGKIGSGKTSLLRMLVGLTMPSTGQITLDGRGLSQINPASLRLDCAYVPQDIQLVSGTLRDNIALKNICVDDQTLLDLSKKVGLADLVSQHPMGLDLPVKELGKGLSGGQRQGIAIARALLGEPAIYLFDEPTSAMDNQTENRVIQEIKKTTEGKTMILNTHRASLLELVDRIVILDGGRIVADGPKGQVLDALKKGLIKAGVQA